MGSSNSKRIVLDIFPMRDFSDVADYANVIERRKDDHLDLERLIACSKGFKEDCIAADIPYCEITDVFDLEWITDRIAAVLELSNTKHGS